MNTEQDVGVNLPAAEVVTAENNELQNDDGIVVDNGGAIVNEAKKSEEAEKAAKAAEEAEAEAEKVKKQKPGKWERQLEKERAEKAEMAARLEKLEKLVSDKSDPGENAPPKIEDFENVLDFLKAEREYEFEKFKKSLMEEKTKTDEVSKQQVEFEKKRQAYDVREAKIIAENPDYIENLTELAEAGHITDPMIEVIYDSEIGEKIALHLTKNPDEAAIISQLSGPQLYRVMGMLEARLSGGQSQENTGVRQTKAAPPINPVKVQSSSQKDPKDMSQAEYEEWLYKGRKK